MKTFGYIFFFLLMNFSLLSANENDDFAKANNYFNAEKFPQAAAQYRQILSSGKHSADLYFNLGITYAKMHDEPHAILYLEKAKLLTPLNGDINLALIATRTKIGLDKKSPAGYSPFFYITGILSPKAWAILCGISVFVLLASLLAGIYLTDGKRRKSAKYFAIESAAAMLLFFAAGTARHNYIYAKSFAIVTATDAEIYSSPQAGMSESQRPKNEQIKAGTKIKILEMRNGMYCFESEKGKCWIAVINAELI